MPITHDHWGLIKRENPPSLRAVHEVLKKMGGAGASELPTVNRFALILDPTEKFLEWVHSTPDQENPPVTLEGLKGEPHVYLIPDVNNPEGWLREHCQAIFEHELNGWWTDPTGWPPDRSHKVFKQFFHPIILSMVVDASEGPLARSDE